METSGFRAWLLRWGHPLAWVLISAAAFVGYRFSGELAYYTALAALTAFLGFFGAWSTATQAEG